MDLKIFSQTNGKISKVNRGITDGSSRFSLLRDNRKRDEKCVESKMNLHL